MKNFKNLFFGILAIAIFTVACNEEFLTKEPQASLSGPALANADGVEGKLISAYRTLQGYGMSGGGTWYYSTWAWIFGAISSDNALKGTDAGDQPEHSFIETYDFNTFNVHNRDKWRSGYWGAARANDVINSVAELKIFLLHVLLKSLVRLNSSEDGNTLRCKKCIEHLNMLVKLTLV